ncbi:unnamed protein product [Tenebrio molitor]|nr:unnamed protein product [Tenebrio molitor]
MSSCSQKRINFTERDKQLLLAIVGKYAKIIEDKSTKNCVTFSKTATWAKNIMPSVKRDPIWCGS